MRNAARVPSTVVGVVSVLVLTCSSAQEKKEAVRISPKEIEVQLTQEEARTSGGADLGKIVILDGWDNQLRLTSVQTSDNITAVVYDLTHRFPGDGPGAEHGFRIDTRLKPTDRAGTLQEWVRVSTNHPDFPTLTIPITYHILPEVQALPRTLLVNRFLDPESMKTVRLTTSARAGLEVQQVTAEAPWLSVTPTRIDANTIDLRIAIAEPGTGDVLKSAITIRTVRPQAASIVVPVVVLPQVACDDPRILAVIATSNRLNREVLSSFSCTYTSPRSLPGKREIHQVHRYGFAGDREYHRMEIEGSERDTLHYVRNGRQARLRSGSPGIALIGDRDTIKRPQDLFEAALGAAGGVIPALDRLNADYDRVVSVRENVAEGHRCIIVTVEQRAAASAQATPLRVLTIHFSVENGFLPVQIDDQPAEASGSANSSSFVHQNSVARILNFTTQGDLFYLPVEFHTETYQAGKLSNTTRFQVDEKSIGVNTALPEELAWIKVRPDNMVADAGLASGSSRPPVQISNPGVRDFWGAQTTFRTPRGDVMEAKVLFGQGPAPTQGGALAGRPLPSLAELGIDLPLTASGDEAVLVCFFDVSQRPSRHCLDVLVKQAAALREKNIIVAAVQIGAADDDAWKVWVKECGDKFPLSQVGKHAEKVKSAWGAQSLPWLILTDKDHVVRAEGFSLDELDGILARLGDLPK